MGSVGNERRSSVVKITADRHPSTFRDVAKPFAAMQDGHHIVLNPIVGPEVREFMNEQLANIALISLFLGRASLDPPA